MMTNIMFYAKPKVKLEIMVCILLREISSCASLIALPGPAWFLLNKISTHLMRTL